MKLKKILYILLALGFVAIIVNRVVANKEKVGSSKNKSDNNKTVSVSGIVIEIKNFGNNIVLSGSVDANEQVEIRSEVSGKVEGIYFNEGSNVAKDQVLVKVNDIELKAQLNQAETKEYLAFENERRAKLLLEKEAISQEEYDVAIADYKSSQSQTQLIKAQISKTIIKAPFSGKIGLRSISPGTYLTPSILITKLVNMDNLKITFSIPEKHSNQVIINSLISFKVASSDQEYVAKIYAIDPEIEVETRTLRVRAIANNLASKLLPGNFAKIKLPLITLSNAVIVPTEAIVPVQNGKKVFIMKNGKAKEVMVETATRTDASVIILSGLTRGDTLVTSGVMALKEGMPIKVKIND